MDSLKSDKDPEFEMYKEEIGRCAFLDPGKERALIAKFQSGDKSVLEPLVRSQLQFVVTIAKKYFPFCKPPIHIMDLIQEGNDGLLYAIEKFDSAMENRLSAYAGWWIRQRIRRFFAERMSLIRVPVYIHDLSLKLKKFSNELGREPTIQEFAEFAKITVTVSKRVIMFAMIEKDHISLDIPVKNDYIAQTSLGDVAKVFVPEEETPEGIALQRDASIKTNCLLLDLFKDMNARNAEMVKSRLGLFGEKKMTLDAIGKKHGITRERVRQIVNAFLKQKARKLRKLKKHLLGER